MTLARACCCKDDPPTIGCVDGSIPANACFIFRFAGISAAPSTAIKFANANTTGTQSGKLLAGPTGMNSTFRVTLGTSPIVYPGAISARIECDAQAGEAVCDEFNPDENKITASNATLQFTPACLPSGAIGISFVRLIATNWVTDGGFGYNNGPSSILFDRSNFINPFPLNTPIANNIPRASLPHVLGTGGTVTCNVIAGPCSPGLLMASRAADPDLVSRQIAALQEPLERQRRASGCRGCGDPGGDLVV